MRRTSPRSKRWALITLCALTGCSASVASSIARRPLSELVDPTSQATTLISSPTRRVGVTLREDDGAPALLTLEVEDEALRLPLGRHTASAAFSRDEAYVAVVSAGVVRPHRRPRVSVLRTSTGALLFDLPLGARLSSAERRAAARRGQVTYGNARARFSDGGAALVTGPHRTNARCESPFEIHDATSGRLSWTACLEAPSEELALSADGDRLAVGGASRLLLYERSRPDVPRRIRGVESTVSLQFSDSGAWLVAETWEGTKLINTASGHVSAQCTLRPRSSRSVPAARQLVATPALPDFDVHPAVAFAGSASDADRSLVVVSDRLCWFDLDAEAATLRERPIDFPVQSARFSPDGRELALVYRFVDGYVLTVLDSDTWRARYSDRAAFLDVGAPHQDERGRWSLCGIACPDGLRLECDREDLPLLMGGCMLTCRSGTLSDVEHICVQPSADSLLPQLEELTSDEDEDIRQRATRHHDRLRDQ